MEYHREDVHLGDWIGGNNDTIYWGEGYILGYLFNQDNQYIVFLTKSLLLKDKNTITIFEKDQIYKVKSYIDNKEDILSLQDLALQTKWFNELSKVYSHKAKPSRL
jgi:hypothetical protein